MSKGKHLTGKIEGGGEILTHEETLRILSGMARNGSVTAAVALARELRLDPGDEELDLELETMSWSGSLGGKFQLSFSASPTMMPSGPRRKQSR